MRSESEQGLELPDEMIVRDLGLTSNVAYGDRRLRSLVQTVARLAKAMKYLVPEQHIQISPDELSIIRQRMRQGGGAAYNKNS